MGPDNRIEVLQFQFYQELEHGDPVEDKPGKKDWEQLPNRQVFIQQYGIVPEIQVCFFMIVFGQSPPPDIVDSQQNCIL